VPVFAPIATDLGFDPPALAILGILAVETGLLTPPFGLLVSTVEAALPDEPMPVGEIFRGSIACRVALLAAIVASAALPQLAAYLPIPGTQIREETRMRAYWMARAKINDPVEYKKYTDRVPEIIARFGGKVLARGGRFKILEGPEQFGRFALIEFPSLEQAVACHSSPEYREAAKFRRSGAGEVELVIVEGGEATKT
jgi:uncharacterized protein (DUF1330 family)